MARKLIAEASAAELRDFALILGLEIDGNENTNVMKAKLATAGYTMDSINIIEKDAPRTDTQDARPSSYRTITLPSGAKQDQVCVLIQKSSDAGGDLPVHVSVITDGIESKGGVMLIARGIPQWIPVPYEEALRNAQEYVFEESKDGLHTPYSRQSYPYSIVNAA